MTASNPLNPTPSSFTGAIPGAGPVQQGRGGDAPTPAATATTIAITVNGTPRLIATGTEIDALMQGTDALGSAIACNREVVPRSHWHEVLLHDGDTIEIVRPTQGG